MDAPEYKAKALTNPNSIFGHKVSNMYRHTVRRQLYYIIK